MMLTRKWLAIGGVSLAGMTFVASPGWGQGAPPVATAGDQVVIKKEACRIVEPSRYRVPLSLEAYRTVTLVAPYDGKIARVSSKSNSKVQSQADVVRMDNSTQKLLLNRAQAALKVATVELRRSEKDEATSALAEAKVELAKADVQIAEAMSAQASVTAPFSGEVLRILVTEGQFVRAGDPLGVVADTKKMKVEIPVDRESAEKDKSIGIKIEADEVEGKIEAVLPLPAKFDSLRDLFESIASVEVVVDNPNEKYKVGQTVYSSFIPRQPVVEVALSAIANSPDGNRKVQVVRTNVVRDIPVTLMGQVGNKRVFVSGAFADADEVIYESSHLLGDAFQLKPFVNSTTAPGSPASPQGTAPSKQKSGDF